VTELTSGAQVLRSSWAIAGQVITKLTGDDAGRRGRAAQRRADTTGFGLVPRRGQASGACDRQMLFGLCWGRSPRHGRDRRPVTYVQAAQRTDLDLADRQIENVRAKLMR
jgi:hypothetical protein